MKPGVRFRSACVVVFLAIAAAGCGGSATPVDDGFVDDDADTVDTAVAEVIACGHPLAELTRFPVTGSPANAIAAAQVYCGYFPKSAASVACPGGSVAIYGRNGTTGEYWWFDASGALTGYQFDTDDGFATGCLENLWGSSGLCTPNPEADPTAVSICVTPTDVFDTSDSVPDTNDSDIGADATPDAADLGSDNTACSSQADCAPDRWCNYTGCGFTLGQCVVKPIDCNGQFAPICGCDGHSYDSICHAQKAGASIAATSAPCLGSGCAPACASGHTCVDCASAGVQCLTPGQKCVGGK